jgi:hypothetical protein
MLTAAIKAEQEGGNDPCRGPPWEGEAVAQGRRAPWER